MNLKRCLAFVALVAFIGPMGVRSAPTAVTVRGYVEVDTEDAEGRAETIGIWDRENREFLYVTPGTGKAEELTQCIGKLVEAKGTVTIDDAGLKSIVVTEFAILPDDSDESFHDDDTSNDEEPQPVEEDDDDY